MFANVTRRARAVGGCCDLCLRLQLAMCLHVDWVMTSRRAFIRADALVAAPAIPGLSAPSSALYRVYTQSQAARIAPRLSQTLAASVPSLPPLAGHHCASCCSEQQKQAHRPRHRARPQRILARARQQAVDAMASQQQQIIDTIFSMKRKMLRGNDCTYPPAQRGPSCVDWQ